MRIAVIGAGISGLAAAYLLSRRHDVVLFEKERRAGGHTNTFVADTPAGELAVDTGFIVYNEPCYPNLTALFAELGVATQFSDMSFGVSLANGAYEYAGDNLATLFVQRSNLFAPDHLGMLRDILKFNARTKHLLRTGSLPAVTLGEFLDSQGYGPALRARYLLPMAGAIWSTSTRAALQFPYPAFARFFDSHGLLNAVNRPQWRTVAGGSRRYVERMLGRIPGARLGQAATAIIRAGERLYVTSAAGEERFDACVSALHADDALALLREADAAERSVLGGIPYATNRAVLHTDESVLPVRRRAWSSWNYVAATDAISDDPVPVAYWMNRLQGLPGPVNYIVSLNPQRLPAAERVLYEVRYRHPQYLPGTLAAQQRLPSIQGRRQTWFCGAWSGFGFHEDGLKSALRVVRQIDAACMPAWAK